MDGIEWSPAEKKIARSAFDRALERAQARTMAGLKARAASAPTPSDMWAIEDYLSRARREIDEIFDYRYSRLLLVFAILLRQGHLSEPELAGLSEEKLGFVRKLLSG